MPFMFGLPCYGLGVFGLVRAINPSANFASLEDPSPKLVGGAFFMPTFISIKNLLPVLESGSVCRFPFLQILPILPSSLSCRLA